MTANSVQHAAHGFNCRIATQAVSELPQAKRTSTCIKSMQTQATASKPSWCTHHTTQQLLIRSHEQTHRPPCPCHTLCAVLTTAGHSGARTSHLQYPVLPPLYGPHASIFVDVAPAHGCPIVPPAALARCCPLALTHGPPQPTHLPSHVKTFAL